MRSIVKFKCPSCGRQVDSPVDIKSFNAAVELDAPCNCGFSQVVLSALSTGIESIVAEKDERTE